MSVIAVLVLIAALVLVLPGRLHSSWTTGAPMPIAREWLTAATGSNGRIYAIDNGLCFHTELKLRTVIWDYAGEPIPGNVLEDLQRFVDAALPEPLADLLDAEEQQALRVRAKALADYARFPEDRSGHHYPWPLV